MKPLWRYSLFGLAAYLLFIVVLFPADRVYALLQQRVGLPLQLYQVSGSVWNGHIGMVRIAGVDINNVDWSLHPWALFLGRLEMGLSLADVDSPIAVVAGRKLDGSYYVRHSDDELSVPVLEAVFNARPFGLTGKLGLDLEDIRLSNGRIQAVSGNIRWQQAGLGKPLNIEVGSFDLLFATKDGNISGTLTDSGGPLQAEGLLQLYEDNSYHLTMTLVTRDKSRVDLKQALSLLGTPSPDGKVSMTRRGRLDMLAATLRR
jgi:hypothetical protein